MAKNFVLFRVSSWIVPGVQTNKTDPRTHTNQARTNIPEVTLVWDRELTQRAKRKPKLLRELGDNLFHCRASLFNFFGFERDCTNHRMTPTAITLTDFSDVVSAWFWGPRI